MRPAREARLRGQIKIKRRIIKTDCGMKSRRSTSSKVRWVAIQKTTSQRTRGIVKKVARR